MTLPESLQRSIDQLLAGHSLSALTAATQQVSSRYRDRDRVAKGPFLSSEAHRLAYLATRLPATYAVVCAVFAELARRIPHWMPKSLLDVGTGPGTGMWAAVEAFSTIEAVTLLEQDKDFLAIGQHLAASADQEAISRAIWTQGDMLAAPLLGHDLVLLSYSLGEIDDRAVVEVVERCYAAATGAFVIVEPGTPRGYRTIIAARDALIEAGAHVIAPCPHALPCPMLGSAAWCHFACRVARTSAHRLAKEGSLGYEDEKYSYLIVSKGVGESVAERVVGHPSRKSGHVHLELCTATEGIQRKVISKKQGDLYQWARRAEWGDAR